MPLHSDDAMHLTTVHGGCSMSCDDSVPEEWIENNLTTSSATWANRDLKAPYPAARGPADSLKTLLVAEGTVTRTHGYPLVNHKRGHSVAAGADGEPSLFAFPCEERLFRAKRINGIMPVPAYL